MAPIGVFALRTRATFADHLKLPPAIGYPAMDYLDYVNSGGVNKTKTTTTLSWGHKQWRASWTTTYQGGYKQAGAPGDPVYLGVANPTLVTTSTGPQGGNTVAAQTYHNTTVSYAFGARNENRYLKGLTVSLSVNNVFNTEPPFDAAAVRDPFFYSRYGNVRLRDFVVRVKKDF